MFKSKNLTANKNIETNFDNTKKNKLQQAKDEIRRMKRKCKEEKK